ncbi:MAG: hypothetical protein CBB68_06985 [Rhodospirillaceae bacterium TMED8]|nr:hypothetical protein [Magnetovibrio sp.]OUT50739.1 MAG: hypothetical protein CBB68_06985 [Rhodospirillaceae bacterium TMED8]|tara:strand:- start:158 stop:343 length:186 start_codon:yes stop_codon:yes gene_type:complete
MEKLELVRFLSLSIEELIEKAETEEPATAGTTVDEAEETLALAASILARMTKVGSETREAA